jgi:transcriptional regulator with XRE-family HTH domain
MQIDAKLIRSEREQRAWSQEHLAAVTGLGLRTIQRIEKTGAASFESARALAAVFERHVASLRMEPRPSVERLRLVRPALGAAAGLFVTFGALVFAPAGRAAQVMLDVGVSLNDDQVASSRLATDENVDAEVVVDDLLRLLIAPSIEPDGQIKLAAKIFEYRNDGYSLVSEPKLVTPDGERTEIRFASESGQTLSFAITPHRGFPKKPDEL